VRVDQTEEVDFEGLLPLGRDGVQSLQWQREVEAGLGLVVPLAVGTEEGQTSADAELNCHLSVAHGADPVFLH